MTVLESMSIFARGGWKAILAIGKAMENRETVRADLKEWP